MVKKDEEIGKEKGAGLKTGKVKFMLGHGSYEMNRPGRGNAVYGPGDEFELNPTDVQDLRAILQILRPVNSTGRKDVNAWNRVKNAATGATERVVRFTVVSGLENLPEVLQKHQYTTQGILLDEEKEAIKKLCPDFPFERRNQRRGPMGIGPF